MDNSVKLVAIVGSYRRGGVIDSAVDALLVAAHEDGAEVTKINLLDKRIEFCTNCRACTQKEGAKRGECPLHDEMADILALAEGADALVIASPMNFWTVTAIMKRFIERLICYAYWPWGVPGPKVRNKVKTKCAVVITSSAAPAIIARLVTRIVGLLKTTAGLLGAKTIGVLFLGLSGQKQHPKLSDRLEKKARAMGKRLVAAARR